MKRIGIDGNLAFVHVRYPMWAGNTRSSTFFRFDDDGRIVGRWDVLPPVSETAANNNSMF